MLIVVTDWVLNRQDVDEWLLRRKSTDWLGSTPAVQVKAISSCQCPLDLPRSGRHNRPLPARSGPSIGATKIDGGARQVTMNARPGQPALRCRVCSGYA